MGRLLTSIDGIEEIGSLFVLFDVRVNEEGIRLRVNVFHHDLKAIEAASLWYLDLPTESLNQVLVDDAIRRGEEG